MWIVLCFRFLGFVTLRFWWFYGALGFLVLGFGLPDFRGFQISLVCWFCGFSSFCFQVCSWLVLMLSCWVDFGF